MKNKNRKSKYDISRRRFIKATTFTTLGTMATSCGLDSIFKNNGHISLLVFPDDKVANNRSSTWALVELKSALETQGAIVRLVSKLEDADSFCILVSNANASLTNTIFGREKITPPTTAESLCLVQTQIEERTILLSYGTDTLGLVYALTELADRVNCLKSNTAALEFQHPIIESPASRTRSIMRNFSSELEDKPWFYDKEYWKTYLDTLIYSRINRFNFSTGMAYNSVQRVTDGYMVFPYPFFVKVPGYEVSAKGLTDEERHLNLEILKFIGKETSKRGLQFQFGIWTLAYNWDQDSDVNKHSPEATYKTEGLTDATHPDYCRDALAMILKEVPEISGITFRVHEESGVSLGTGSFWEAQFSAVANCGRQVEIDMHAKNMEEKTLYTALATGQPVVVSPKFCGEHLGLPYHQSSIREFEMLEVDKLIDKGEGLLEGNRKFTRYGYADMLSENRTWDVIYRIWPGTQRFLLSGDPTLFAGYGRTADFCGAAGFEISEPLNFKGRRGTGREGGRCGYADTTLTPRYDFEKYTFFYRTWGRLGYNPDTKQEVWQRALSKEFGSAGLSIEIALGQVTRVLPLFYHAHGVSCNCMVYLPEIYTNTYMAKERNWPYDTKTPKVFGNISPMDPQLFQSPNETGAAIVKGENTGKYSSVEVAYWLEQIAEKAKDNIKMAEEILGPDSDKAKFRRIEEDVLILIGMAQFFAAKLRSAVLWEVYTISGSPNAGDKAIELYASGRDIWADMAERAKKVYRTDISYGPKGHWIDRIPSFDEDIAEMKEVVKKRINSTANIEQSVVKDFIIQATTVPVRPTIQAVHYSETHFNPGIPLTISLEVYDTCESVSLYYRHVNQSEYWQSVLLGKNENVYTAEIPALFTDNRFPIQYYFEIKTSPSSATMFPHLADDLATVPYFLVRRKA